MISQCKNVQQKTINVTDFQQVTQDELSSFDINLLGYMEKEGEDGTVYENRQVPISTLTDYLQETLSEEQTLENVVNKTLDSGSNPSIINGNSGIVVASDEVTINVSGGASTFSSRAVSNALTIGSNAITVSKPIIASEIYLGDPENESNKVLTEDAIEETLEDIRSDLSSINDALNDLGQSSWEDFDTINEQLEQHKENISSNTEEIKTLTTDFNSYVASNVQSLNDLDKNLQTLTSDFGILSSNFGTHKTENEQLEQNFNSFKTTTDDNFNTITKNLSDHKLDRNVHNVYTSKTCDGKEDADAYMIQINEKLVPAGILRSITMPCKTSGSVTSTPVYLTIWQKDSSGNHPCIAISQNAVVQKINTDSVWYFDNVSLTGKEIRLNYSPTNDKPLGNELWNEAVNLGLRKQSSSNSSDRVSGTTANANQLAALTFEMAVNLFDGTGKISNDYINIDSTYTPDSTNTQNANAVKEAALGHSTQTINLGTITNSENTFTFVYYDSKWNACNFINITVFGFGYDHKIADFRDIPEINIFFKTSSYAPGQEIWSTSFYQGTGLPSLETGSIIWESSSTPNLEANKAYLFNIKYIDGTYFVSVKSFSL